MNAPISPAIKQNAIKVAEAMTLMSRRLTEAANSDDMLILRRELNGIGLSMEQAGTMLVNGMQSTSFDTAQLRNVAS